MLEIVLLILKIAGIIFVSVLGILIVVVCFALFVPARYRGDFSVSDGGEDGKKTVGAKLRATWLLHLVRVSVSYEETPRVRVKVLFFTLMDTAKEKRKKRRKRKREEEKDGAGGAENAPGDKKDDAAESGDSGQEIQSVQEMPNGEVSKKEPPDREKALNGGQEKKAISAHKVETGGKSQASKRPKGNNKGRKKKEAGQKKKGIKAIISKILQTIRDFCDKLKGIRKKAEKIEELWLSDHMVSSRSLLGKQLRYLLRHTKPKRLAGYIRFGFDDPSTTGYAMAAYGILYPIWSPKLSVEPDFEKQVLDCHILIKGKIRVWHFVRAALRMLLSGDVRRVIKDVRKL